MASSYEPEPLPPFSEADVKKGLSRFSELSRQLLGNVAPHFLPMLGGTSEAFLEPLLFSHLTASAPAAGLDALLYPYVERARRSSVVIPPDARGVVYLPRIGYFNVDIGDRVVLGGRTERGADVAALASGDSRFEPILTISGTNIELLRYDHPLMDRHFSGTSASVIVDSVRLPIHHEGSLARAIAILRSVHPRLAALMELVTRRVHVFHSRRLNSFATLSAFGCAFLNTKLADTEVFFIEDLVHQCGHILFSAVTFEQERYLRVVGATPLRSVTGDSNEERTLYTTLHGLVTEALMTDCLGRCLEQNIFTGARRHELLGRLGFIFRRFHRDLENLAFPQLYTEEGIQLYEYCRDRFHVALSKHGRALGSLDLGGQGENFDYPAFRERNSASVDAECGRRAALS